MIEEILEKVAEAEKNAENIKSESEAVAREIRANADKKAKEEKEIAFLNARVKKADKVLSAKNACSQHFGKTLETAEAEAEKYKTEKSGKVEELSEDLFGRIRNGDC